MKTNEIKMYNGFGIRFMPFYGNTEVLYNDCIVKILFRLGKNKGLKEAKIFIDNN